MTPEYSEKIKDVVQEIYRERLKGEDASEFVAQSTFLADAYRANGLFHEAESIYKKLLDASPKNKKFRKALEDIKLSMN